MQFSNSNVACLDHVLGYMYHYKLGASGNNLTGNQTVGDVTLSDIQSDYWTGTNVIGSEG